MAGFLNHALIAFLRLVTRVFFRTVEVVGLANVPLEGAVIFVGNHPNSLIDPVLITTTSPRPVRFAAKDVLFQSRVLKIFLAIMGAVPIKRRQDHGGGPIDNSAAFDALFAILGQGQTFGIFPEGISHAGSELAPLKTGAARIALGAARDGNPVRVVPCGLTYHRRTRLRSRVLIQFGEPIEIDPARVEAFAEDERAAARALTEDIELALRALTINTSDFDTLRVLDGVRRLYAPPGRKLSLAERAELSRRFIAHWERLKDDPEVKQLYDDVALYQFKLSALGLRDRDLLKPISRREWATRLLGHAFLILVLLPFALPGIVLHAPVLVLAVFAGEALTARRDVKATTKLMATTVLVLFSYAVVVGVVAWAVPFPHNAVVAPLVLGGLLLSGWATIRVLERQSVVRKALAVFLLLLNLKDVVRQLRQTRDALRARTLALVDAHLDPDVERVVPSDAQPRGA